MKTRHYQHLFGPVPSRRFGLSLGVDLVPLKTCSFDCCFCQLGRTPVTTLERREYVPTAAVLAELDDWLTRGGKADYISLAGSGEPTLHSRFGEILSDLRRLTTISTALLTNGSRLSLARVRSATVNASVVKVSLSAWDQQSFARVNGPHPRLHFEALLEGMRLFRQEYSGELWLETVVLAGINDSDEKMARIAALAASVRPDRVHLNTVVRPPAAVAAKAVTADRLAELAGLFQPPAEAVAAIGSLTEPGQQATEDDLLEVLRRRPCTREDLARISGLHRNELAKYLGHLQAGRRILEQDGYYTAVKPGADNLISR